MSLQFKNGDYENEWRLSEILDRKTPAICGFVFCVLQDIVWTGLLMETTIRGKVFRGILDLMMMVSVYLIYYRKTSGYHQ